MFARLGNIDFEITSSFTALKAVKTATYVELPRLNQKPILQRTADGLNNLNVEFRLLTGRASISETLALLETYRADGEVLPLTLGTGEFLGNYVILKSSESKEVMLPNGGDIATFVQLELKEYINVDPEAAEKETRIQAGFATDRRKVVPVQLISVPTSPAFVTSQSANFASAASSESIALVQKAQAASGERNSIMAQAKSKVDIAVEKTNDTISNLESFQDLATKAPALLAVMQSVASNAESLKSALAGGNLGAALTSAALLTTSVDSIPAALLPLNIAVILRQEI